MARAWLLGLLVLPALDVVLLGYVATQLGLPVTVLIVVLTALVGLLLVRAEGRRTVRRIRRAVGQGEVPTDELLDGGLIAVAGILFVTPGLVTDAIALACVIPPTRVLLRRALKRWVVVPYVDSATGGFGTGSVYVGGFPDGGPGGAAGPDGGGEWVGGTTTTDDGVDIDVEGPDGDPADPGPVDEDAHRIDLDGS
jgi:UPF0716 protein FxsA